MDFVYHVEVWIKVFYCISWLWVQTKYQWTLYSCLSIGTFGLGSLPIFDNFHRLHCSAKTTYSHSFLISPLNASSLLINSSSLGLSKHPLKLSWSKGAPHSHIMTSFSSSCLTLNFLVHFHPSLSFESLKPLSASGLYPPFFRLLQHLHHIHSLVSYSDPFLWGLPKKCCPGIQVVTPAAMNMGVWYLSWALERPHPRS